jgi:uncharacterized membrane protein
MNNRYGNPGFAWPLVGCFGLALSLLFLCLMPFLLVDAMRTAMERLHLHPAAALLAVIGIFIGGLFNIPVYRIERVEEQPVDVIGPFGFGEWMPTWHRVRRDTIVAVNVGGCLIPLALVLWEVPHLLQLGGPIAAVLAATVAANVFVCYRAARPVRGVGIAMPGLLAPLVSVGMTWLLLGNPAYDSIRAPIAFVAGVLGPLIGADLLHLKDIMKVSAGVLSIGGAGTFDGIVLSGLFAALFA